jgi:hypothetical protein
VLSERDAWVRMRAMPASCTACSSHMPCPKARATALFQRHREHRIEPPLRLRCLSSHLRLANVVLHDCPHTAHDPEKCARERSLLLCFEFEISTSHSQTGHQSRGFFAPRTDSKVSRHLGQQQHRLQLLQPPSAMRTTSAVTPRSI